jgi:hypothetical protein
MRWDAVVFLLMRDGCATDSYCNLIRLNHCKWIEINCRAKWILMRD